MRFFNCLCRPCVVLLASLAMSHWSWGADTAAPKTDPKYPFRTDHANEHLPWYQPKLLEFPPFHSDHRVSGELVKADFIHRTGQFRMSKTGELVDFTMPPYATISYLNAEADLRDVPLGTFFLFFLNQDADGKFTRLATMQDQYTMDAGHSFSYRLDELKLGEGKLITTKRSITKKQDDLGKKELLVTPQTRVWKSGKQVKLEDLIPGDDLLYNLTGRTSDNPGFCSDIWAGADTHKLTTEQQRQHYVEYTKARGIAGWVEDTQGNQITVTLFTGDAQSFQNSLLTEFAVGKGLGAVVANEELRTWNPAVDREQGTLKEIKKVPTGAYGTSGVQFVFTVSNMLEGFRKGRVMRIFGSGWPLGGIIAKGPFYGESLMNYGYGALQSADFRECTPKDYPEQYPFRTDHGNARLPWYQVKEGVAPPRYSEHLIFGELIKVDAATQSGQFRTDRTGEVVNFTMLNSGATVSVNTNPPGDQGPGRYKDVKASIRYRSADTPLAELPTGQRYRFHTYQDSKGEFTRVSLISDEISHMTLNALTHRVTSLDLARGFFDVGWRHPEVKNYNGDMEQPPDFGHTRLLVDSATKVWKGAKSLQLTDIKVGDNLHANFTSEQPGKPSRCSDIWIKEPQVQVSQKKP